MNEEELDKQKNQSVKSAEGNEIIEPEIEGSDMSRKPDKKRIGIAVGSGALILMVIIISVVATTMMQNGGETGDGSESSDDGGTSVIDVDEDIVSIEELTSGEVDTTIDGKKVTYNAKYIIDGVNVEVDAGTFESTSDDEVVFLVINGGTLKLGEGVIVNKSGSADFDGRGDAYSFYGTNSAIAVVGEESTAKLEGIKINTSVNGANAVVATKGGNVTFSNITINTTKDASRGLHATYGGLIAGNGGTVTTQGQSCAALATDRGEGTVEVSNMKLSTVGAGSPLIYSTGAIKVTDSTGTATGAQIAVVEGKNSITLDGCDFSANGIGNRNNVDNAAVMIYQSMSGDASVGVGSFTANDTKMTVLADSEVYETTPFFFITNTTADISLDNVEASFCEDGYFILAAGTDEWGRTGANGGIVSIGAIGLTATNTNVGVDDISSVKGL